MGNEIKVRKTWCNFCPSRCRLDVQVRNDEVIAIRGSRDSGSGKSGFICEKARLGALDFHNDPRRLNYPLKRIGERGEGRWERVSWTQAMDETSAKIAGVREKYGPEAVSCMLGNGNWCYRWLGHRWCNLFGTPNRFTTNMNCFSPQLIIEFAMYGSYAKHFVLPEPGVTKCMVMCGTDPYESLPRHWRTIVDSKKHGAKLIVIDPRYTREAEIADLWLQIRPGTDAALLYGMLNVILREELYDKEFVAKWCLGFDEIKTYARQYSPEVVEDITWIPKEKVIEAARMYATNKPGQLGTAWGVTHSQLGSNAVLQANLAKCILRAITGNLDVEGGIFLGNGLDPEKFNYDGNMHWDKLINHPLRKRDILSAEKFPLGSLKGFALIREVMNRVYKGGFPMDIAASPHVSPSYMWRAILEGKPYPIKVLIINGINPMCTRTNIRRVYEALRSKNLELIVVADLFMTPSGMLADYVFPAADWLEVPFMVPIDLDPNGEFFKVAGFISEQSVARKFERRPDYDFWRELAIRLGQGEYWPETLEDWYSDLLQPSGYTFRELELDRKYEKDIGLIAAPRYRKYERSGFATASGKVELVPSILRRLGYEPLAPYSDPPRTSVSRPDLIKDYPFILITGGRIRAFKHSMLRGQEKLRKLHPDPIVQIHPEAARKEGIVDGDWVCIETPEGRIKQKAEVTSKIHPKVVHVEHAWWFPEQAGEVPNLFGVWESNAGAILPDDPDECDYQGGPPIRALLCKIYKVK